MNEMRGMIGAISRGSRTKFVERKLKRSSSILPNHVLSIRATNTIYSALSVFVGRSDLQNVLLANRVTILVQNNAHGNQTANHPISSILRLNITGREELPRFISSNKIMQMTNRLNLIGNFIRELI